MEHGSNNKDGMGYPVECDNMVNSIWVLMNNLTIRVVYFLREGSTLADYFANLVFLSATDFEFNDNEQSLNKGKNIFRVDKSDTPNIKRIHQESK